MTIIQPGRVPSPKSRGGVAGIPAQAARQGRARDGKPCLRDVIAGTGAFLLAVAACLYLVAQLGS
jgi:hypothetical protein